MEMCQIYRFYWLIRVEKGVKCCVGVVQGPASQSPNEFPISHRENRPPISSWNQELNVHVAFLLILIMRQDHAISSPIIDPISFQSFVDRCSTTQDTTR